MADVSTAPPSRDRRRRRGANAIEFALLLPAFWFLIAACFDFGWLLAHQVALDEAANRGCRAGAIVDPGDGEAFVNDVRFAARQAMLLALERSPTGPCEGELCTLNIVLFDDPPQRSLRCDVRRDFEPLLGVFVGPRVQTSGAVAMMEWQRWP